MRFKIDENLPRELSHFLTSQGHDAQTVSDQSMDGQGDVHISTVCRRERRVLLTLDTGFADIRRYPPKDHSGIVVLRLNSQAKPHVLEKVQRLFSLLQTESLSNRLWIVEEHQVRIRE
jgi:predicted nuclease of predicted toxin-antitoxin system